MNETSIKPVDYFPVAKVLNWNYRFHYFEFYNEILKSNCVNFDIWFIGINWDIKRNKFFGYQDVYYDGHQVKSFCLFGVMFSKGYTYMWNEKA
jgi:hypothetical protein